RRRHHVRRWRHGRGRPVRDLLTDHPEEQHVSQSVFVANRGEIAVRVVRAAQEAGLGAVVAVTREEADSLAARLATGVHVLPGEGAAAYLDAATLVAAATEHGCTLLHPGYGFLSESPALARARAQAGVTFVGPD